MSSGRARVKLNPYTGQTLDDSERKISMPLKGKPIAITDKLLEMHVRRDRVEMMNYQQKMIG